MFDLLSVGYFGACHTRCTSQSFETEDGNLELLRVSILPSEPDMSWLPRCLSLFLAPFLGVLAFILGFLRLRSYF